MTVQLPDIVVIEDGTRPLHTTPMESFFRRVGWSPRFDLRSSDNWRGTVARWEILGRRLYLTGIVGGGWIVPEPLVGRVGADPDPFDRPAPGSTRTLRLEDLFPRVADQATPSVPATWFTGILTVPLGGVIGGLYSGFGDIHESYRLIEVVEGRLRRVRERTASDWARRMGRQFPVAWFEAPIRVKPGRGFDDPVLRDWRRDDPVLRDWCRDAYVAQRFVDYVHFQQALLRRPGGTRLAPAIPWPRWRNQRREAALWLKEGRCPRGSRADGD